MSRYRNAGLRLHAYVDQAVQGQVAPTAGRVSRLREVPRLIDLQPALAEGGHLAEHRHEALLIHPLKHLQGLEALAHRVLPQPVGLIGSQIVDGDADAPVLGFGRQLAVRLGPDQP